jgi:hypothetical protein
MVVVVVVGVPETVALPLPSVLNVTPSGRFPEWVMVGSG